MSTLSLLFDPKRITGNRRRACNGFAKHNFMHKRIWQDLMERKEIIKRDLIKVEVIGDLIPDKEVFNNSNWIQSKLLYPYCSELDFLCSFLELHLIDDLPGVLLRYRQALKADGVFLGAMFGGHTLQELRHSLFAAESQLTGGAALRVIPFVDVRTLGQLVQAAGFALPVIDVDTITVKYKSITDLLHDLRNMGESNPGFPPYRPLPRAVLSLANHLYIEKYGDENGLLPARFDVLHICGWAPHNSQQQPLAPGSGQMFLGDAFKKS
ncbi:MAG: hypothetical protein JKY46_07760 [Robiginitomaculum sp.]|nr:hypothetical protein [Robiginitomaculum sp.]